MPACCNESGNEHTQTEIDGGGYMVEVVTCNGCGAEKRRNRI